MINDLIPMTITFNLPKLLELQHGDKLAFNVFSEFTDYELEDITEHQEYESKYTEIVKRANHFVEVALLSAVAKADEQNFSIYCYTPLYQIQEDGKMIGEFYFYYSDDHVSDCHDNRLEVKSLEEQGIHLQNINVTKYFKLIKQ